MRCSQSYHGLCFSEEKCRFFDLRDSQAQTVRLYGSSQVSDRQAHEAFTDADQEALRQALCSSSCHLKLTNDVNECIIL